MPNFTSQVIIDSNATASISLANYVVDIVANGNITQTNATTTVDSTTLVNGWKVLCTSQTDSTQNGVWIVNTSGAWTRDPNFLTGTNWKPGLRFYVQRGASNIGKIAFFNPEFDNTTKLVPGTNILSYRVVNTTVGTSPIRITKTNTAGYKNQARDYPWKGRISGLVNNVFTGIVTTNHRNRDWSQITNASLSVVAKNFAATTNRITLELVPVYVDEGYLVAIDEVRDSFSILTNGTAGLDGPLLTMDGVAAAKTVTINSSATPADKVVKTVGVANGSWKYLVLNVTLGDSSATTSTFVPTQVDLTIRLDYEAK